MKNRNEPLLASYLHAKGAELGLPISGTFELTARCNFCCPMCYVHSHNAKAEGELTAEQWLELAGQAKEQGMIFVLLTGGEPFLRKDFFEIYEAMKEMGLMISINTNGSLLSGEIRERLIENPPFRLNISLYGGCGQTYHDMCGTDAFERVLENIRGLKRSDIDIRLNYSITPYNRQDMSRINEIARELGVHIKASSYMYPPVRTKGESRFFDRLSAEESAFCTVAWDRLRLNEEEFIQRAQALKTYTERGCSVETDEGVSCRAGSTSLWITWDGRMLPCGMMPGPEAHPLRVGFDAAWQFIREATSQIRLPAACAVCAKREMCSICAAVCVSETGSFDGVPDYVCRRTEATVRLMQTDTGREGYEDQKRIDLP